MAPTVSSIGCTRQARFGVILGSGKARFGVSSGLQWEGPLWLQQWFSLGRFNSALAVGCAGKARFSVSSRLQWEIPIWRQQWVAVGSALKRQQQVSLRRLDSGLVVYRFNGKVRFGVSSRLHWKQRLGLGLGSGQTLALIHRNLVRSYVHFSLLFLEIF